MAKKKSVTLDPVDKKLPTESPEMAQLRRWRSEFQLDFHQHKQWYDQKRKWEDFYDGDQIDPAMSKALKERGQPEVVINLIKPRVDGVIGDFLGRRVMMRARDRGTLDFDKAKHVTEALRYVEDHSRFDDKEAQVAEDMLLGGIGWYKSVLKFDFLDPEIRVTYRSNNDIVLDRRCRQRDLSDAKRLWETVWVEVEDLIEVYPEYEQEIREASQRQKESFKMEFGQDNLTSKIGDDYAQSENVSADTGVDFETFIDPERNRIRLIQVWERTKKRIEFAFHPNITGTVTDVTEFNQDEMSALKSTFPGVQLFADTKWLLNSGIFIATKVLEYKEDIRPHDSEGKFPFARAVGHVKRSDQNTAYGIVKQYMDPQMEYNKRRSKLLHKSNVNRVIAEEGAFPDNDVERIRKEAARPDGVILHKAGKAFEIDKDKPDQTDVYLLELSQSEIERSGVSREFIGQENTNLSGKAIGLRQMDGQKMLRPFFSALRSARRDIFTIVLEEIQQYWTSEKLIKITDDPLAGEIILNQKVVNPETGRVTILNDLRLGKYDIKIDEDAETPNQRQENFNQLAQLGQVALSAGYPFPFEMLIKSSDLPNKKEWLDAIQLAKEEQMKALQMQAMAGAVPNKRANA